MSYLQRMNNPRRCKPGGQPALTMEFSPRPTGCLCRSSCANCRHSGHLRMLDGRDVDNVREVCCSNYLREFNGSVSKVTGINTGHHLEERNWSWPWRCSNFHFFWGGTQKDRECGAIPMDRCWYVSLERRRPREWWFYLIFRPSHRRMTDAKTICFPVYFLNLSRELVGGVRLMAPTGTCAGPERHKFGGRMLVLARLSVQTPNRNTVSYHPAWLIMVNDESSSI